jgi:phosphatidylinositol-3,4,5-trisphosphate 3-phosphatase/dual-specificity protein phosphatase PTEN
MIVAYMLHCGYLRTFNEAAALYGDLRTRNGKGITIQSQMRSVRYFEKCINKGWSFPIRDTQLLLKSVLMYTTPRFKDGGCKPWFILSGTKMENGELAVEKVFDSRDKVKPVFFKNAHKIFYDNLNLYLSGDYRLKFLDGDGKGQKMFQVNFNTNFVDKNTLSLIFVKKELDGKGPKDVKDKFFDADFHIELKFELIKDGEERIMLHSINTHPSRFGVVTKSKTNGTPTDGSSSSSDDDKC